MYEPSVGKVTEFCPKLSLFSEVVQNNLAHKIHMENTHKHMKQYYNEKYTKITYWISSGLICLNQNCDLEWLEMGLVLAFYTVLEQA